ncbi:MAG: Hpt domain-containing protein [Bacteroidia bacterium]
MQTKEISWNYLDASARSVIEELMDGDAEMIIDLVDALILSSPDLLRDMEKGIHEGDGRQVREAAHALKSSNAQLGALALSSLCAEMEKKGREGDITGAEELYTKIMEEFDRVESALGSWKSHLTSTI